MWHWRTQAKYKSQRLKRNFQSLYLNCTVSSLRSSKNTTYSRMKKSPNLVISNYALILSCNSNLLSFREIKIPKKKWSKQYHVWNQTSPKSLGKICNLRSLTFLTPTSTLCMRWSKQNSMRCEKVTREIKKILSRLFKMKSRRLELISQLKKPK